MPSCVARDSSGLWWNFVRTGDLQTYQNLSVGTYQLQTYRLISSYRLIDCHLQRLCFQFHSDPRPFRIRCKHFEHWVPDGPRWQQQLFVVPTSRGRESQFRNPSNWDYPKTKSATLFGQQMTHNDILTNCGRWIGLISSFQRVGSCCKNLRDFTLPSSLLRFFALLNLYCQCSGNGQ